MKPLITALQTEKAAQSATVFWLVNIGNTYFYTDSDIPITYGGNTYQPYPLQISGIKSSDGSVLDGGTVSLGNATLEQSSFVLNHLYDNQDVFIYEAWFDSTDTLIDAELVFAGKVDGTPALDELWAGINVSAHLNPWSKRFPTRIISRVLFPFIPIRNKRFVWGSSVITIK